MELTRSKPADSGIGRDGRFPSCQLRAFRWLRVTTAVEEANANVLFRQARPEHRRPAGGPGALRPGGLGPDRDRMDRFTGTSPPVRYRREVRIGLRPLYAHKSHTCSVLYTRMLKVTPNVLGKL